MQPISMTKVIGGVRYNTEAATLIASDAWWDGHNFERSGRNVFLYRSPRGNYFIVKRTMWQGERDSLRPVSLDEALRLWEESLPEHEVPFEEAFPTVSVTEA